MKILVTGGAGFLGSALVRRLHADGHQVSVLDDFSRGKAERIPEEITRYRGDIRNAELVRSAVREAEVIWHLAYCQGTQTFYERPELVIDVALTGMMNLLHACVALSTTGGEGRRLERPREFFLVSSSEAYQIPPPGHLPTDETVPLSVPDVTNPRYSYGAGKIACEVALLAFRRVFGRAVIVRPHNIYGPDMGYEHVIPEFALRLLDLYGDRYGIQPFPIQGTGAERRSFCYIEDCTDGLALLQERAEDGHVYHLGNPHEEIAVAELAHQMARIYSRRINVEPGKLAKGSPPVRKPDIGKLVALGFRPHVTLEDGLHQTLQWYLDDALQEAKA